MKKKRYAGLDRLRGCILISMILYHATWDMVYIFGEEWSWFESGFARIWQQSICWSFILLSGFCWNFGKQHWKRGVTVFVAGIIVTLVTRFFMPENLILCGVLTLIGSCMLLMTLLDKVLKNCAPVAGAALFFAMFVVTRNVNYGYLGFEQWNWIKLPEEWYANGLTTYLGFMQPGFYSADYFSLFPWLFLFVTGYFLYRIFQKQNWMMGLEGKRSRWLIWLEWLGKHSLIIYMIHQPIVYGLLLFVTSR